MNPPAAASADAESNTPSGTLSEAESKRLLSDFGIPFAEERMVDSPQAAAEAAAELGMPVVAKLCGDNIAHKTERGLVRLGLSSTSDVLDATDEWLAAARPEESATGVLIAPMVAGDRELIAGASTDAQFGHTVLLGIGGILAEAVADVSIRLAPITELDAHEMIEDLRAQSLLGEFRGQPPIDRAALCATLLGLSDAICNASHDGASINSIDLNPLIVCDGTPIAVDALVELGGADSAAGRN
ncbi:MAG: acetate--CoA ligase family protein [Microthrixaceae bacterium]